MIKGILNKTTTREDVISCNQGKNDVCFVTRLCLLALFTICVNNVLAFMPPTPSPIIDFNKANHTTVHHRLYLIQI